jgi:hypothetical protein
MKTMVETAEPEWIRQLEEQVTVSVAGLLAPVPPGDDGAPAEKAARRVLVEMPDYVADMLGHQIRTAADLTDAVAARSDLPGVSGDERALADALLAAARFAGYRCALARHPGPEEDTVQGVSR